ncbi:DUF3570 domain-containing protein [Polyangium sorediatum]|uniref:DUF3570 domain-containing protein n=1 Tax=Polyangium sorediatum TaxID=889274 RepID=A0ABT6P126_9BACT|nr:DUF3570 domain-containing protein [Polyangium sorediatum]MDI1434087.1 DUF3570 domain-containing protein [Polyangium sorediatum]
MRRARQLIRAFLLPAAVFALVGLTDAGPSYAGDKDADGLVAVAEAMNEFVEGKYDKALSRLDTALKACKGKACEPSVRAEIQMAIGVVQGAGKKKLDAAKKAFESALKEDANVKLDKQWATKELEKTFTEARQVLGPARPPPTKQQMASVTTAQAALAQKDWSGCMQTLIAEMATSSEFAAGKLMLAKCQDAGGLLLEAAADAQIAAKFAEEENNAAVGEEAKALLEKLQIDTPTITLQIPSSWSEVEVKIDGVVVPADKVKQPIPHNPGKATIEAKGKRGKFPTQYKSTEAFDRGEQITVNVDQGNAGGNNSAVFQCMQAARTPADMQRCIDTGGKGRGFTLKAGVETMFYTDTLSTTVVSPAAYISGENPTAGWQVGGSFIVDVVSTASPDIVATASRRWNERRFAGSLSGDFKVGPAKIGLNGAVSVEPDYLARSVGVAVSTDLKSKMVTPTLAYNVGFDVLSRAGTPFEVFREDILRHTIDAGVSLVIDPSMIVVVGGTAELVFGDTSKPYRHIPMFTQATADRVPLGATRQVVSQNRLPFAPLEQLPTERSRFALVGRAAKRFEKTTIRGDERVYVDTWGQMASTTDARFFFDVNDDLRLGSHLRFNIQSSVDFWKRAYVATQSATGWNVPEFRSSDRELGALMGFTLGANARYALARVLSAQLQVEGLYNQYFDHIYVFNRFGLFTAVTLELEVD